MFESNPYPPLNHTFTMGVNGMVASVHILASTAGLNVLADGGNAFDAAVTVGSTLSVVEPHMSGIGGIGVGLAYLGSEGKVIALDFSGREPKAAKPSLFDDESKDIGALAPLVPGNVAGWLPLHEKHGSMDLERLLRPAINYAEDGFPVTHLTSFVISQAAPRLRQFQDSAFTILGASGKVPTPGSRIAMPALASSLRLISTGGGEEFYRGGLSQGWLSESRPAAGSSPKMILSNTKQNGRPLSKPDIEAIACSLLPHLRPASKYSRL